MQIKTKRCSHVTQVRMALIKKSTNNKFWKGYGEKGTPLHCCGNVNWYSHCGRWYGDFLKKLGIKLPYDPAILLLGIYPEETRVEKDTCITLFIVAQFTIDRTWKQPRCLLTDEWIKKLWYIYTMEYYSAIKEEHIWVSSDEVDEPRTCYTEWSKTERER